MPSHGMVQTKAFSPLMSRFIMANDLRTQHVHYYDHYCSFERKVLGQYNEHVDLNQDKRIKKLITLGPASFLARCH